MTATRQTPAAASGDAVPGDAAPGDAGSWEPAVGAVGGRRLRYELIGCALAGHDLPLGGAAGDAAVSGGDGGGVAGATGITAGDPALVRSLDGLTWHRCLRCDAWMPLPDGVGTPVGQLARRRRRSPDSSSAARHGVQPPLRGRPLRDRYVLRLIALDRAVHVLVLVVLGLAVVVFVNHRTVIRARITRVIADLQGGMGGPVQDSGHGIVHDIDRVFALGTGSLYAVATGVFLYAALEATEMVGLWLARRWAEYLTLLATLVTIPFEVDELIGGFSVLKVLTFVINVGIAVYLLASKRLFGVRGGGRAEEAERQHDSGWTPVDRATPPVGGAVEGP